MANVRNAQVHRPEAWKHGGPDRFPQLLRLYYVLLEREVLACVLVDYSSAWAFAVSFQTWRPPGIDRSGGGA